MKKFPTMLQLGLISLLGGCVNNTTPKAISANEAFHYDSSDELENFEVTPEQELKQIEHDDEAFLTKNINVASLADRQAVQNWIIYFTTGKGRDLFERHIQRGAYYKNMIQTILKKHKIPTYFYYLAMIESGFSSHATSTAKAAGVWQFMPKTAQRYGLRVTDNVDERRDPIRSTIAATQLLRDLYNVFHSWFLAMAAYNAGESRVMNSIMNSGERDYWRLVEKKAIPPETREYIPKFIAAVIIGNHLEKYNFSIPQVPKMPNLVAVSIPSPAKISDILRAADISQEDFRKFNPHLQNLTTPPEAKTYRVWFEKKHITPQLAYVSKITPTQSKEKIVKDLYIIKKGDTLEKISKKFNVSLVSLKELNHLKRNHARIGSKILLPKKLKNAEESKELQESKNPKVASNEIQYEVRRGDNLLHISKRFNTTVQKIREINDMKSSRIYPGQTIKIRS